jgi:uncharacterized protein YutE (UPF0331/DUF86 family)
MVKRSIITAKIMMIEEFISRVREKLPKSFEEFENDRDAQDLVLFNLIQAIQSCVDIAAHIVSDESLGYAGSMNEFFYLLQQKHIISMELTEKLISSVGFRNVCVHGYLDLDFTIVYQAASSGVSDLEAFIKAIVNKYL